MQKVVRRRVHLSVSASIQSGVCVGPRPLRTRTFSELEGVINGTFERLDQMGDGTVDAATLTTALQVHGRAGCLDKQMFIKAFRSWSDMIARSQQ